MSKLNCRIGKSFRRITLKSKVGMVMTTDRRYLPSPYDPIKQWALTKMIEEACKNFNPKNK